MNRIYKVIWSKVRNCYVAVSEIAKRNGKGCGAVVGGAAVNCGAKGKSGRIMSSLHKAGRLSGSLWAPRYVAAALLCAGIVYGVISPSVANAAELTVTGVYNTPNAANAIAFTTEGPGTLIYDSPLYSPSDASVTTLNLNFAQEPDNIDLDLLNFAGGSSSTGVAGKTVNVSGKTKGKRVIGGYFDGEIGDVTGNTVNMSAGEFQFVEGGSAYRASDSDDVTGNTVNISGGTAGDVYGGNAASEGYNNNATGNTVTISQDDSTIATSITGTVYGGYSYNGNAGGADIENEDGTVTKQGNTVTISGGTVGSYLFGGYSENGSATGNTVSISGGTVPGAYGGYSRNDSATGNTVNISGGEVNGVYGGYVKSGSGNATGNTVILSKQEGKDAPVLNGTVYGGYSGGYSSDAITGNTLQVEAAGLSAREIRNFEKYSFVLPDSISADETMPMLTLTDQYNNLTVDGSKVSVAFTGDNMSLKLDESITLLNQSGGSGTFSVTNVNESFIERLDGVADGQPKYVFTLNKPDGEDKLNAKFTEKHLYGDGGNNTTGQREKGNTLNITDGMEANAAFGGRATGADVTGNTVIMTGGDIKRLYPSEHPYYWIFGNVHGGYSDGGNAGGEDIDNGDGTVTKLGNTVTISGGVVGFEVYGGYAYGSGNATCNMVNISGGVVNGKVVGGYVTTGSATGNTVNMTGGALVGTNDNGCINGGYANGSGSATGNTVNMTGGTMRFDVRGGFSFSGNATGNTVIISGSTVRGVYGGYVKSGSGNATGNTVILSKQEGKDAPKLGMVYGGYSGGSGDCVTGNTLQVEAAGLSAYRIQNFEKYSFVLPDSISAGNTMLTLTAQNSNLAVDVNNVSVAFTGDNMSLELDESVTLLNQSGGSGSFSVSNISTPVTERLDGAADGQPKYVFTLNKPDGEDKLNATFTEKYLYGSGGTNTPGQREKDNTLNITDGMKATEAYGGRATSGDVTGNTVNMSGGTVTCGVRGGYSHNGNATGNTVSISGGTVQQYVIGGFSLGGIATGNTVTISGGAVGFEVYGGYAYGSGNATRNTVILSKQEGKDAPVLNGTVYGGYSGEGRDAVTGNTLQLEADGLSAKGIRNFETIRLAGTLAWKDGATVFEANQFNTNADDTRASLDVTDATKDGSEFVKTATDGQMTLLSSDTAEDFKTLSLVYSGGTEALSGTNLSKVVKTVETPEAAPVNGVTVTTTSTHTVSLDAENSYKNVLYTVESVPTKLTLGAMTWGEGRDLAGKYTFDDTVPIDAENLTFTGAATTALKKNDSAALVSNATGITADNEVAQPTGDAGRTVAVDYTDAAGIHFAATASGHVAAAKDAVNYVVDGVAVNSVDLQNWNGTTSTVTEGWTAGGLTVETDGMSVPEVEAGKHIDILQSGTDNYFANATINGANAYKTTAFAESDPAQSVTIVGSQGKGVKAEGKNLVYALGTKDVDTVTLGKVDFVKDAVLFDRSSAEYNYAKVKALGTDNFAISYDKPETVAAGDTMTLLKANKTLADMAAQARTNSYEYEPVAGVKVKATVTGSLTAKGGAVTYRTEENRAGKLTFTNVDWKDSGALLTRPSNIVFAGADVDTAKIHFKNIESLQAKKKMTLVSDFGDSVGTITGNKYTVGTGLEGEGAASLAGSDLIFTAKTGTGNLQPQEQAHKAVMAMEAGIAMLAAGSEHVGMALGGLAAQGNGGPDGTSTFASVGGGASRYETGSHVNTNTWNALVAAGGKKETEKGALQYGLFGEYGKGNYTLHSSAGRGDGDAYYAGGGLLAKWTNKHNVYTEASFRLGRMSDTASDILHDAAGNGYGYDVHANYYGGHVGFGKVFSYKGGRSLDVYGKYFYTKRDGVNFTAGGSAYDLDSVASSVLRVGARYGTTDRKWNWYGGLAYDYEFDGEATGKVDGVAIRSASVKGGSVRGELGLRMDATKDNPWKADISVYGYGGKHRGFGGNVSVAYTF